MTGSEYNKRQEGTASIFDVTPAQAPKFMLMAVGGGILALLGLFMGPFGWILFLPIGIFGVWFGYFRDGRPQGHRVASSFRVSPSSIEANGRTFQKDDIHRLIIKNGLNNEVLVSPNIVIPVNTSTAMGVAHRARLATLANGLEVETGGRAYLLAGGMDQTTAFGLMTDVSRIMGFSTA